MRPSLGGVARCVLPIALFFLYAPSPVAGQDTSADFTVEQVKSYPFPNELVASASGDRMAWALNEEGLRNIWVAEGPAFEARRLTNYIEDDGQELTSVQLSADGQYVVYVRGGEHGGNWSGLPPNPTSSPVAPKVQIWSVPFAGGDPTMLTEADNPAVSPTTGVVAFLKDDLIWTVPVDGSAEPEQMFFAHGDIGSPTWSPDGSRMAFVSGRGDHSFIGIYSDEETPILWLEPCVSRDYSPRWSPDGERIAFIRRPGSGGAPEPILGDRPSEWSIWTADASTGEGKLLWESPDTPRGSRPSTHGGVNLHWAAGDRIVFLADLDGWPHLYSVPDTGGEPMLLTPGEYMAEYIRLSPDGEFLVFAANAGNTPDDIDRRHIVKVPVDRATPEVLTPGTGIEWSPVVLGDGERVAFLGATAQRPPLPAVMHVDGGPVKWIGEDRIPDDFPTSSLVTPKSVAFTASDGVRVHGQIFERPGGPEVKPAIIFAHGGPPRQMLLGWHYSDYYSNAYALNQYLANQGYVVLAVNYRLGIGYGHEFHRPPNAGDEGASEYLDIVAGGEYLASLPQVDPQRIGIYGGSYGGFLTAMALAKDSDLFAAGVDIHGVHDWTVGLDSRDSYEQAPDWEEALEVAWQSSPVAHMDGWRSPVLLIHADDDRNVEFHQTVDLVQRLNETDVEFETIVIPDDTHHFMRHANWVTVDKATADFFDRIFGMNDPR